MSPSTFILFSILTCITTLTFATLPAPPPLPPPPPPPTCPLSSPIDPATIVLSGHGHFTSIRIKTPYTITNLGTKLPFLSAVSSHPDLLSPSAYWELVPTPTMKNVYRLVNFDPAVNSVMTRVHRSVKLGPLPGTPDVFTLHPDKCRGRPSTGGGFIYSELIDPAGLEHTECHAVNGTLGEKHKFKFVSFLDALKSRGLHIGEKIVGIVDLPSDIRNHFATSLSPPNAVSGRKTLIKNCASGRIEQEIEVKSETSIRSRLEVQDTFVVGEEVGEKTSFGVKVGVNALGLFNAGTKISKSWQQDTSARGESHSEKIFIQEEISSITHATQIEVGNHSCLEISATSAIFKNTPWRVNLTVELALGQEITTRRDDGDAADAKNDATIFSEASKATIFLHLMKFSGLKYTFNETTGTIRYLKPAKLQVTSLVSTNTAIQQVHPDNCTCGN